MTHEYGKLPLWAQNRIKVADMRLAEANAKIDSLFGGISPKDTDTVWQGVDKVYPLPRGAVVGFRLGTGPDERIAVRVEEGELIINGHSLILVHPQATNAIRITMEGKP